MILVGCVEGYRGIRLVPAGVDAVVDATVRVDRRETAVHAWMVLDS